jgi:hypothetical protein
VFEEGSPKEEKPLELDPVRLSKARLVHVVFPSRHQIYVAKSAVDYHYQASFPRIRDSFFASSGNVRVKLYLPNTDYSNRFLYVLVSPVARRLVESVNLLSLYSLVTDVNGSKKATKLVDDGKRHTQGLAVDLGLAGNVSAMQGANSPLGHSVPGTKPFTDDPRSVKAFTAMDCYYSTTRTCWRRSTGLYNYLEGFEFC